VDIFREKIQILSLLAFCPELLQNKSRAVWMISWQHLKLLPKPWKTLP